MSSASIENAPLCAFAPWSDQTAGYVVRAVLMVIRVGAESAMVVDWAQS
jgi:hypothetical protein